MAAQWRPGQQGYQYPMQTGYSGNPQLRQNPQFQPQPPQFQPQNPQFQPPNPQFQPQLPQFLPQNPLQPQNPQFQPQLPQFQLQNPQFQPQLSPQLSSQLSWALSKAEKKKYNDIFRTWDPQNTSFVDGPTALSVFRDTGLPQNDLARIWTLADIDDRGKLNIAEFHVAMGLIYRRLNGMPIPDQLPAELVPPSSRDLNNSVDLVKDLLKHETRSRSPASLDAPVSRLKNRSFNSSSPSLDANRDATIYKHSDSEPPGGFYKPRNRHVDRDTVRSRDDDDDSPTADLSDMKRRLANTAQMLERTAQTEANRTKEDEELDQEMDDLKYRVKRVHDDLDYNARPPRTSSKEEERRRLERELLTLMHERIPDVERKIKAREERREREKRQWARDRDRANDRHGRYDDKDDYYRRNDDRDRLYFRGGDDRDRPYSRGTFDRDEERNSYRRERSPSWDRDRDRDYERPRSSAARSPPPVSAPFSSGRREHSPFRDRDRDRDYERPRSSAARSPSPVSAPYTSVRREHSPSRDRDRDRDYERPRSSTTRSPPPPVSAPVSSVRDTPPIPQHQRVTASPRPDVKKMTQAERQAFIKAEGQRLTQARMAALGVTAPTSTPVLDTSVEDRLQQEKKEAEEKAKAAEKQAEEREKARKERLENAKSLKEGKITPSPLTPSPPAVTARVTPKVTSKVAPPPPKSRAAPSLPANSIRYPPPAPVPATPVPAPAPTSSPVLDTSVEDRLLQERKEVEERAKAAEKQAEERERARKVRLENAKSLKEGRITPAPLTPDPPAFTAPVAPKAKSKAAPPPPKSRAAPPPPASSIRSPPPAPAPATRVPAPAIAISPIPSPAEKSTNPFSRLIKEGGSSASAPSVANGSSNPWSRPPTAQPPSELAPSKSPVPNAVKTSYNTAPSSLDDDWDEIEEKIDSDSSDDEITQSRTARANIAQQLFGNILPRPTSAAAPAPPPALPSPVPPPPPAPLAPAASAASIAPVAATSSNDVSALMQSIQGGMKLRPTKTVVRSAPPVSGKVLGEAAPPPHISATVQSVSPSIVQPRIPPLVSSTQSDRQSTGWLADRAADVGSAPDEIQRLPSTLEDDEEDIYQSPPTPSIPRILVDEPAIEPVSDLMADIDKSIQHRVRSLYAFEGDGPEDLFFGENLIIIANPSKSGGDWWYGTISNTSKSGLFPKTYVEVVKSREAKAIYAYASNNSDELTFAEGDILSIVDMSEEEWWKAQQGGVVFIVPAAYLEVVEDVPSRNDVVKTENNATTDSAPDSKGILQLGLAERHYGPADDDNFDGSDSDSDTDSNYVSFDGIEDEESNNAKETREREQLVLEAAGLVVNQDVKPPPRKKHRPAPPIPQPASSRYKDLPQVPDPETESDQEVENVDHEASLDDAFARYESFRNNQSNLNRLSVMSTDSATLPGSPTPTISSVPMSMSHTHSGGNESSSRYSHFLQFLKSGNKTPEGKPKSVATLNISAPIMNTSVSNQSTVQNDVPSRSTTPSFGMSWASLVDKTALEGIPPGERKRQEAIFELINTEVAYVRDLQLIVEVFYSSLLSILSEKEITVVFANIEDILLANTGFVSSLEERQKECRLYIDRIGDNLLTHIPNMGVYTEYCVNQSTAIKVLQSLRENNPELASHLQHLRDENTAVRNLDLSSYLLAPMQRITRYPLLLKQILQYTEVGEEHEAIKSACDMAERLLNHINETIRDQEGADTLKKISQFLWVGEGRLDLTVPTRYMGPRKLLKQGNLLKAKSRRKLYAFLCSDILVLTDESMKTLYRLPIPVAYTQVKESGSKDETTFVLSQTYPQGGDSVTLRAPSHRDCQQWIQEIDYAGKRARRAEEKVARKLRQ